MPQPGGLTLEPTRARRAADTARVKAWVRQRFDGEETLLVTETACATPGCPPRQTVIVLFHPCATVTVRFPKPLSDVTEHDIRSVGTDALVGLADTCC